MTDCVRRLGARPGREVYPSGLWSPSQSHSELLGYRLIRGLLSLFLSTYEDYFPQLSLEAGALRLDSGQWYALSHPLEIPQTHFRL